MSITWKQGNLLNDDAECLVNAVNCVGVAGAGIALAFKQKFYDNFRAYSRYCQDGHLRPGGVFVDTWYGPVVRIYAVATKNHWREPSEMAWVQKGLNRLGELVREHKVSRIALPALGCGLGGLPWDGVRPLIERHMNIDGVDVRVYEPEASR